MGPVGYRSVTCGPMTTPDLAAAGAAIDLAFEAVGTGARHLTELGGPDTQQVLAYDLAHAAAAMATARSMLDYGAKGDVEARLTCAFVADAVHDLVTRLIGRDELWGVDPALLAPAHGFVSAHRDPELRSRLWPTSPGRAT